VNRQEIPEAVPAPPEVLPVPSVVPASELPKVKAIPSVLPVEAAPPEVLPIPQALAAATPPLVRPAARETAGFLGRLWRGARVFFGWVWRIVAGAFLCFNTFILSYFTSIAVFGWTYRWMQAVVLRGWWKQSPLRRRMTFDEFCDSLGPDAPVARPRWFLRERMSMALHRPGPGGAAPGPWRLGLRIVLMPWHSFWRNFKIGVQGLFCTYLLTGWGCMLMLLSWEYGWLNSFNKGYEQSIIGPLTGFLGSLLFIIAMFYVPMAQAHQAATGQARAFFDFRFVWTLIRARLTAYVGLAFLIMLASLVLNILVLVTVGENFVGNAASSPQEGLAAMRQYLIYASLAIFPTLLLLRLVAAVVYRSAVFKVLRKGTVARRELHPVLAGWLERLDLTMIPKVETAGLGWYARFTGRFAYRRVLFTLLFLIWVTFVMRFYVGAFFRTHPGVQFLVHPMIQLPCFDFIPQHLYFGRDD
jgi:hypothetical protein